MSAELSPIAASRAPRSALNGPYSTRQPARKRAARVGVLRREIGESRWRIAHRLIAVGLVLGILHTVGRG